MAGRPGDGAVPLGEALSLCHEPAELRQLADPEGGLDVGEPVVESQLGDLVVPAPTLRLLLDAVVPERAEAIGKLGRVGGDRTPFSCGYDLHRMERERGHVGVGTVPDRSVGGLRPERMRGVLDDNPRPFTDYREVDGQARIVDGDQRVPRRTERARVRG